MFEQEPNLLGTSSLNGAIANPLTANDIFNPQQDPAWNPGYGNSNINVY